MKFFDRVRGDDLHASEAQEAPKVSKEPKPSSFWSTHFDAASLQRFSLKAVMDKVISKLPQVQVPITSGQAMAADADDFELTMKMQADQQTVPDALAMWYASQGFIGHQLCAILSQNWLVDKACTMPGRDALRCGFDIVSEDGDELDPNTIKVLRRGDRKFQITKQLEQFVRKGRIFGIRIAFFNVESDDLQYYEKPFNPDGIKPGSYKGITQIDPYWCGPMLDGDSASNPATPHFYDPVWWFIAGRKYHRSHLIIFRNSEVADILKPSYLYGGVPVPQQIMERVYAAERVANEAPMLAQTKRTTVWLTDMEAFMADQEASAKKLQWWSQMRDNYGVKVGAKEADELAQFDTSLADLDNVIMTQYQIVAAAAKVPATKLLGTTPKGFNSTGDYEEASYHEELESIQTHDLTPFLERHYTILMRSEEVKVEGEYIAVTVNWLPLDSPTAKELAETNQIKAQTGNLLIQAGAITAEDERKRVAMDKESGYAGIDLAEAPDGSGDDPQDDPLSALLGLTGAEQ